MANLQRVIMSILLVGVLTGLGLLAMRPITDLFQFVARSSQTKIAAVFGAVLGTFSVPVLFLLAFRLSGDFAHWVLQGPPPFSWLGSELALLATVFLSIGIPVLAVVLLRGHISRR
ncbi:MAG: hypothetical protein R6U92_05175 [Bacillota bacterium]